VGYSKKQLRKTLPRVLDSARDYKRLNAHLHFIIINFRREQPSGERQLSRKFFAIYTGRNVWLIINN